MIIRFSVENFRSFKERQTLYLSTVKTCKEWLDENTALDGDVRAVRTAVVYGANASGKTNLLFAMQRLKMFMLSSVDFDKKAKTLFCEPFMLVKSASEKPTTFEIEFTVNGRRFEYGFSIQSFNRSWENYAVVKEWLLEVERGKTHPCFLRERQTGADAATADVISVDAKRMPQGRGLEQRTRPDVLFFTVAAQFAEPTCQMISEYIGQSFNVISRIEDMAASANISAGMLANNATAAKIKKLITDADIGVKDISVGDNGQLLSWHSTYDEMGNVVGRTNLLFGYMESEGTKKIFNLSGMLIDTLQNGRILVVDELDAQLHPILVRHLMELFNSPETNPKNAQLIFNTQSADLLGYKVYSEEKGKKMTRLRRDQIYFVEKDNQEASRLFSLVEFKKESGLRTRNDASYEKDYLSGVYGGIPFPQEMIERTSRNG